MQILSVLMIIDMSNIQMWILKSCFRTYSSSFTKRSRKKSQSLTNYFSFLITLGRYLLNEWTNNELMNSRVLCRAITELCGTHANMNQLAGSQKLHLGWGICEVSTWSGGELPENCEKMEQAPIWGQRSALLSVRSAGREDWAFVKVRLAKSCLFHSPTSLIQRS